MSCHSRRLTFFSVTYLALASSRASLAEVALRDYHVDNSRRVTGGLTSAVVTSVLSVSTGFSVSLRGPCSGGSRGPWLIDPNHMGLGRGVFGGVLEGVPP